MTQPTPPLFASAELARQIELAEVGLLTDCAVAASRGDPGTGARSVALAGGVAVWAGADQPFNKVAGLGFGGVPAAAELNEVEAMFDGQGAPTRVELASLGDPEVGRLLTRRGYLLAGFENVLGLPLPTPGAGVCAQGIEVAASGDDELSLWTDVLLGAFAQPDEQGVASDESFPRDALERAFADLAAARGFVRFLARRSGEPAGAAGLRLSEGIAQLCGAGTLPGHRRRGVQSSLLAARLAAATASGCKLAVVTTLPGSKSQQNAQRSGFDLLYTRAVLVRSAG